MAPRMRGPAHAQRRAWALRVWVQRHRIRLALYGAAGALALLAGMGVGVTTAGSFGETAGRDGAAPPAAPSEAAGPVEVSAGALQDPSRASEFASATDAEPVRLSIPSIGVDTALESLGLGAGNELLPPVDFDRAGWFAEGTVPGDVGPSIIAGHVDSPSAPAVFLRIGELAPGDEVVVDLSNGESVAFTVTGTMQTPKAAFPTSDVYGPTPRADLRLITCSGSFDDGTGHYLDNVVVFATRT
ncbi:class F sortase [Microbacterium sp. SLBN-146]|uniref:class F sortase n=1 Tax=Microbacterium sp. SLBN-146 TaxID=2768457 RepID=UPI001C9313AD|nr:class F sortase [Microbacterium sp. SLBN-146]